MPATTSLTPRTIRHTSTAPHDPAHTRVLAFEAGDGIRFYELTADLLRLGRGTAADLCFDDGTVSRRHALLLQRPNGDVELIDEHSLSGTWVNGERVDRRVLRHGDAIRVGRTVLSFLDVPDRWMSPPSLG